MKNEKITLACGGGGTESQNLIRDLFYRYFDNEILRKNEDAAVLELGKSAFSTDSFTVDPLFFNGGDIGKIAVAGTCNDLSMMGAKPRYLSVGFMIEEGLEFSFLEKIVRSMSEALQEIGVKVVCGDTKVLPKGNIDKIFINTSGIGDLKKRASVPLLSRKVIAFS